MTIQTSGKGQWTVPSQTTTDTIYLVRRVNGILSCDCNGFFYRGGCRHAAAVAAQYPAPVASTLTPAMHSWGLSALTGGRQS